MNHVWELKMLQHLTAGYLAKWKQNAVSTSWAYRGV